MAPTCCSKAVPAPPVANGPRNVLECVLSSEVTGDNQFEDIVPY